VKYVKDTDTLQFHSRMQALAAISHPSLLNSLGFTLTGVDLAKPKDSVRKFWK